MEKIAKLFAAFLICITFAGASPALAAANQNSEDDNSNLQNGIFGGDLGNLLMLQYLFEDGSDMDLGDLYLLNNLFGNEGGLKLDNLNDLILLDRLFNN